MNKTYIEICKKENKMFFMLTDELFESMTIQEYNERFKSNFSDWNEIDNQELFSPEEVIEFENVENIKFQ